MTKNLEKLYLATRTLVGPGPIKQRLVEAFEVNLEDLDMGELPEQLGTNMSMLIRIEEQLKLKQTSFLDAKNKLVMPGLINTHIHLICYPVIKGIRSGNRMSLCWATKDIVSVNIESLEILLKSIFNPFPSKILFPTPSSRLIS